MCDLLPLDDLERPLRDSRSAAMPLGPRAPVTSSKSQDSEASWSDPSEDSSLRRLEEERRRALAVRDVVVVVREALAISRLSIMSETGVVPSPAERRLWCWRRYLAVMAGAELTEDEETLVRLPPVELRLPLAWARISERVMSAAEAEDLCLLLRPGDTGGGGVPSTRTLFLLAGAPHDSVSAGKVTLLKSAKLANSFEVSLAWEVDKTEVVKLLGDLASLGEVKFRCLGEVGL